MPGNPDIGSNNLDAMNEDLTMVYGFVEHLLVPGNTEQEIKKVLISLVDELKLKDPKNWLSRVNQKLIEAKAEGRINFKLYDGLRAEVLGIEKK